MSKLTFYDAIVIAQKLQDEIDDCIAEESEWTSDYGNDTNSTEAIQVANTILTRLKDAYAKQK